MTSTIGGYIDWECPQCGLQERTRIVPNRWHVCPRLQGVSVQLVRKGVKAKIELVERQDYVADEEVQLLGVNKRPIMAAITTREDGNDVVVFAPVVRLRSEL